jgi:type 1 glutamine amidotransferase
VKIRVERPDHPIAAPFGSASFPLTEEIYQFKEPYDRNQLTVLLSLDTSGTDMSKQGIKRKDNDFGLAWIKPYGQGRVFYTALGHNQAVWGDPRFQAHVLAGVLWSMGRR